MAHLIRSGSRSAGDRKKTAAKELARKRESSTAVWIASDPNYGLDIFRRNRLCG
jgi:hypothetical protein